jgi:hypothetical protein
VGALGRSGQALPAGKFGGALQACSTAVVRFQPTERAAGPALPACNTHTAYDALTDSSKQTQPWQFADGEA